MICSLYLLLLPPLAEDLRFSSRHSTSFNRHCRSYSNTPALSRRPSPRTKHSFLFSMLTQFQSSRPTAHPSSVLLTMEMGRSPFGSLVPLKSEDLLLGSPSSASASASLQEAVNSRNGDLGSGSGSERDSSYQRYELQQVGRWIEQILPFSLLSLVVFIHQHLQGFFITIWVAAVMFKSNDILRKQTALKYVVSIYWWYRNDSILYPLLMLPPKATPPFWHVIFIITRNDLITTLTCRYNGEASSNGFQVFAAYVLQERKGP